MRKLALGDGKVYVTLSLTEFTGLTGETPAQIADGTEISLVSIKQKLDLVDSKESELAELKTLASNMVDTLTAIGI